MALIRPFTHNGVEYPEAYSRITSVRGDKERVYVFVVTNTDEDSRFREDFPIGAEELSGPVSVISGDLLVKAYDFIKTQPGFEEAVDHINTDAPETPPSLIGPDPFAGIGSGEEDPSYS
jgi:hypothetical protein